MEKGLGGSDKTKTDAVDSRGLTQKDKACLIEGLNIASAIASKLTGQNILLEVTGLGVCATGNSPALVEKNDQIAREWEVRRVAEQKKIQSENSGGMNALVGVFAAIAVAQAGGTGKQVLAVLESTGAVVAESYQGKGTKPE